MRTTIQKNLQSLVLVTVGLLAGCTSPGGGPSGWSEPVDGGLASLGVPESCIAQLTEGQKKQIYQIARKRSTSAEKKRRRIREYVSGIC